MNIDSGFMYNHSKLETTPSTGGWINKPHYNGTPFIKQPKRTIH